MAETIVPQTEVDQLIRSSLQRQAELGRGYAPEFIGGLADTAGATLKSWLIANCLPEPLVELLDALVALERAEIHLQGGSLSDWDAAYLVEILPRASRLIVELGGVFEGGGMASLPRKALRWEWEG